MTRDGSAAAPASAARREGVEFALTVAGALAVAIAVSAVQKIAIGVSLHPRGFVGAAAIGIVLGVLVALRTLTLNRSLAASRRDFESLKALLDALPHGIAFQEGDGRILWQNASAARLVRADLGPGNGGEVTSAGGLFCYESRAGRSERCESCIVRDAIVTGAAQTGEVDLAEGGVHRVIAVPYGAGESGPQRAIISFVSVDRERRERDHLRDEVASRELLLREIHHRMKNNLQLVASLISLQSGGGDDGDGPLGRLQGRVRAMALVHEQLHTQDDLEHVNLRAFFTSVVGSVVRSMSPSGVTIGVRVDLPDEEVRMEHAAPLGLIVNELASNSAEHAFRGRAAGTITLTGRRTSGWITIDFQDDGVGLSREERERLTDGGTSMGMQLVVALSRQIDAELHLPDTPAGFRATLRLPAPTLAEREIG